MPSPWKDPRTGMYYVRRKVPDRIKDIFGKAWWKVTLNTKDSTEAKKLFPEAWAECERDFEVAEAKLASRSFKLTTNHAQSLATEWLKERLESQQGTPDQVEIEDAQMDIHEALHGAGDRSHWLTEAEQLAKDKGLPIDPEADALRDLAYELIWADHRFWILMTTRMQIEGIPEPTTKADLKAVDSSLRLGGIYERFEKEDKPDVRRKADFTRNMDRFTEMHGDIPAGSIKPEQVVAWKDSLVDQGLAPSTINDRLRVIYNQTDAHSSGAIKAV